MSAQDDHNEVPEIKVIAEIGELIVVDKPTGLAVHNGSDHLVERLSHSLGERLNLIHRLDRETSGVLLLARGREATAQLQESLQASKSHKEYMAIVRGRPQTSSGEWSAPLTPKAEGRRQPAGHQRDRISARTRFDIVAHNPWLTQLRCELVTGRQHQIRKHAALAGCHLVGDRRYGDLKHAEMMKRRFDFVGCALHAARLILWWQGERRVFEAPLPPSWERFGLEPIRETES